MKNGLRRMFALMLALNLTASLLSVSAFASPEDSRAEITVNLALLERQLDQSGGDSIQATVAGVDFLVGLNGTGFETPTEAEAGTFTLGIPEIMPEPEDEPQDEPQDEPEDGPQDEPEDEPQDEPEDEPQDEPEDGPQDGPQDEPEDGPQDEPQDEPVVTLDIGDLVVYTSQAIRLYDSRNPDQFIDADPVQTEAETEIVLLTAPEPVGSEAYRVAREIGKKYETFHDGDYSLENIANAFSAFTSGNFTSKQTGGRDGHVVGSLAVGGDLSFSKLHAFGGLAGINNPIYDGYANYTQPTYVKGSFKAMLSAFSDRAPGGSVASGIETLLLGAKGKDTLTQSDSGGYCIGGNYSFALPGGWQLGLTDDYIDFDAAFSQLSDLSQNLANGAEDWTGSNLSSHVSGYGSNTLTVPAGSNVLVSAQELKAAKVQHVKISGSSEYATIINMKGENTEFFVGTIDNGGSGLQYGGKTSLIWNYPDASSVTEVPSYGLILAPNADIDLTSRTQDINGCLIGKSVTIGSELHLVGFTGKLPKPTTGSLTLTKKVVLDVQCLPTHDMQEYTLLVEPQGSQDITGIAGYDKDKNAIVVKLQASPDHSGTATVTGLPLGEYKVSEDIGNEDLAGYTLVEIKGQQTTANITPGGTEKVEIENCYEYISGSLSLSKSVTGVKDASSYNNKDFTFFVKPSVDIDLTNVTITGGTYDAAEKAVTVTVKGDGTVSTVNGLPIGSYTVSEDPSSAGLPGYDLTVPASQNITVHKEAAAPAASVALTNTYKEQKPDSFALYLKKSVTGDADSTLYSGKVFTFIVTPGDGVDLSKATITGGTYDQTANTITVPVKGNGDVSTVSGLPAGEYTVSEDVSSADIPGFTLTAPADATVILPGTGATPQVELVNNYQKTQQPPASGSLVITKNLAGAVFTQDYTFHFQVTGATADGSTIQPIPVEITVAAGQTSAASPSILLEFGSYTVTETNPGAPNGFTFVSKSDDVNVTLSASQLTASAAITNTYSTNTTPPPTPPTPPTPPSDPDSPPTPPTPPTGPDNPPEEIPEEAPPLAELPDIPVEEILEEEIPLAEAPATGDATGLWLAMTLASAIGLAVVTLTGKKRKEV